MHSRSTVSNAVLSVCLSFVASFILAKTWSITGIRTDWWFTNVSQYIDGRFVGAIFRIGRKFASRKFRSLRCRANSSPWIIMYWKGMNWRFSATHRRKSSQSQCLHQLMLIQQVLCRVLRVSKPETPDLRSILRKSISHLKKNIYREREIKRRQIYPHLSAYWVQICTQNSIQSFGYSNYSISCT